MSPVVTQVADAPAVEGQRRYKFYVLFVVYVAFAMPTMFLKIVFPVVLRQSGAPLQRIGLLGLLSIPFVVKFLWAPLVDRYGSRRFGHYKTWLIFTQLGCALIGGIIAFLDLKNQFWWLFGWGVVFVTLVSTQWIAINGLAVQCLSKKERAAGNSLATISMALGSIAGGSMLILVGNLGYTVSMLLSLSLLLLASLMLLFYEEPSHAIASSRIGLLSCLEPLKWASMRRWLLLINLCIIGDALIIAMVRPMLVDQGLSTEKIGLMLGTVRPLFSMLGAALCSFVIACFARKTNLISFGVANTIAMALFIPPALNLTGERFLYVVFAAVGFVSSFKWTLIYAIFMDHARKSHGATDFALQVSVIAVGSGLYELASGFLCAQLGYASLFIVSVILDFLGIMFVGVFYRDAVQSEAPAETCATTAPAESVAAVRL